MRDIRAQEENPQLSPLSGDRMIVDRAELSRLVKMANSHGLLTTIMIDAVPLTVPTEGRPDSSPDPLLTEAASLVPLVPADDFAISDGIRAQLERVETCVWCGHSVGTEGGPDSSAYLCHGLVYHRDCLVTKAGDPRYASDGLGECLE